MNSSHSDRKHVGLWLSILLIVFLIMQNVTAQEVTFSDEILITGQTNAAKSIFNVDLDGDGDFDLLAATASYTLTDGHKVGWFENTDGLGSFGPFQVITIDVVGAQSVFGADLDGDGDNDALSASYNDNKIAWYPNIDGLGTFGDQQVITLDTEGAKSVFCADLDGDGDQDVLSASSADSKIAWYENRDGNGTFGAQQIISVMANWASCVYSADLDGDGDFDAISGSSNDNKIAWYENLDGNGMFGSQHLVSTSAGGVQAINVADLNGDTYPDIVAACYGDDKATWYENIDGQGNFGSEQVITSDANGVRSIVSDDLDDDGDNDVLVAAMLDDKVAWFENTDGQGTFGSEHEITTQAYWASSVISCDIDGDSDNDILTAAEENGEILWFENVDALDDFESQTAISPTSWGAIHVISVDFDDDGDSDVLAASERDKKLTWFENDGQGNFGLGQVVSFGDLEIDNLSVGDIDQDGDNDIVVYNETEGMLNYYVNDGHGNFAEAAIILSGSLAATTINVINLDDDELPDIAVSSSQENSVTWVENDLPTGWELPVTIDNQADGANALTSADFDLDGDIDLIVALDTDGRLYRNDGQANFETEIIPLGLSGILENVDLDGDGDFDLVKIDVMGDRIVWHENSDGQGSFGPEQVITTEVSQPTDIVAGDFDGDGLPDLGYSSHDDDIIAWQYNNDDYDSFGLQQIISENADGAKSVCLADLDGDGDLDVLSASYNDNKIAWYRNESETGVEEEPSITTSPNTYSVRSIYPNPFNPTTTISFDLPVTSRVNLDVFDISGSQVEVTPARWFSPGHHQITFDGSNLSSGIYIYRLSAGDFTGAGKMVLMK